MARSRFVFQEANAPHFLTLTVVSWLPVVSNPQLVTILFESLRFLQKNGSITVYGYVILENHLHMIASAENLGREIGRFKSFTARKIIDHLKEHQANDILKQLSYYKLQHKSDRDYQLWQEGSHPKKIQGEKMMRQKIEYIHNNPVKRGYVDDPAHWRYSSARNYEGLASLLDVECDWW